MAKLPTEKHKQLSSDLQVTGKIYDKAGFKVADVEIRSEELALIKKISKLEEAHHKELMKHYQDAYNIRTDLNAIKRKTIDLKSQENYTSSRTPYQNGDYTHYNLKELATFGQKYSLQGNTVTKNCEIQNCSTFNMAEPKEAQLTCNCNKHLLEFLKHDHLQTVMKTIENGKPCARCGHIVTPHRDACFAPETKSGPKSHHGEGNIETSLPQLKAKFNIIETQQHVFRPTYHGFAGEVDRMDLKHSKYPNSLNKDETFPNSGIEFRRRAYTHDMKTLDNVRKRFQKIVEETEEADKKPVRNESPDFGVMRPRARTFSNGNRNSVIAMKKSHTDTNTSNTPPIVAMRAINKANGFRPRASTLDSRIYKGCREKLRPIKPKSPTQSTLNLNKPAILTVDMPSASFENANSSAQGFRRRASTLDTASLEAIRKRMIEKRTLVVTGNLSATHEDSVNKMADTGLRIVDVKPDKNTTNGNENTNSLEHVKSENIDKEQTITTSFANCDLREPKCENPISPRKESIIEAINIEGPRQSINITDIPPRSAPVPAWLLDDDVIAEPENSNDDVTENCLMQTDYVSRNIQDEALPENNIKLSINSNETHNVSGFIDSNGNEESVESHMRSMFEFPNAPIMTKELHVHVPTPDVKVAVFAQSPIFGNTPKTKRKTRNQVVPELELTSMPDSDTYLRLNSSPVPDSYLNAIFSRPSSQDSSNVGNITEVVHCEKPSNKIPPISPSCLIKVNKKDQELETFENNLKNVSTFARQDILQQPPNKIAPLSPTLLRKLNKKEHVIEQLDNERETRTKVSPMLMHKSKKKGHELEPLQIHENGVNIVREDIKHVPHPPESPRTIGTTVHIASESPRLRRMKKKTSPKLSPRGTNNISNKETAVIITDDGTNKSTAINENVENLSLDDSGKNAKLNTNGLVKNSIHNVFHGNKQGDQPFKFGWAV